MSVSARDMLNRLRSEKQNAARQKLDELRAQQSANTSPFPIPAQTEAQQPQPQNFPSPPFGSVAAIPGQMGALDPYSPTQRSAAAQGVDVDTGADIDRKLLGLAPNKAFEASFAQDLLGKRYGTKIQVRTDGPSGELEFLHPKTKRWTVIDERSFSKADLADLYGPGRTAAGGVVGSIVGIKGGPAGIAMGAGTGAFLGELWRLMEGKKKGVHNMSYQDMTQAALGTGGEEAAYSYGADKILHLGQLAKRFFSPRPIAQDEAAAILKEIEESIPQDVEGLSLTVPQQLNRPDLQGELDAAIGGEGAMIRAEQQRDDRNKLALDRYIQTTLTPDEVANRTTGAGIQGVSSARSDAVAARVGREQAGQEQLVRDRIGQLPIYDEGTAGDQARKIVAQERERLDAAAGEAWGKYETAIGLDRANGTSALRITPSAELTAVTNILSREQKGALFDFQARQTGAAIPKLDGPMDLADLDRALKAVRARIRDQKNGLISSDISTYDLERIAGALANERAAFLKSANPDALAALEAAEAASRLKGDFDRSVLGNFLVKEGNGYRMTNYKVFRDIFLARDVQAATELASLASKDPAQKKAMQDAIWALYRREATENGLPKPTLHERFLDNYGEIAKQFFDKDDWLRFAKFGDSSRVIVESAKRNAEYIAKLKSGLSQKIETTDPDKIMGMVLSPSFTRKDAIRLRRIMTDAGAWEGGKSALGYQIVRKITGADGELSLSALQKLLKENAGVLEDLYGPGYVADLIKLQNGIKRSSRPGAAATEKGQNTWQVLTRPIIRPLSREGLVRTAAFKLGYEPARRRVLYEILSDPAKLKEYVRIGERQKTDRRVFQFMATVGGASLLNEE